MKDNSTFHEEERAVSPVVGVALLIAIAVILAAVVGAVVLGLGTNEAEVPQASLSFDVNATENTATIHHDGGETLEEGELVIRGDFGNEVESLGLAGGTLDAGESVEVDLAPDGSNDVTEGDDVNVIWVNPEGEEEQTIGSTTA